MSAIGIGDDDDEVEVVWDNVATLNSAVLDLLNNRAAHG